MSIVSALKPDLSMTVLGTCFFYIGVQLSGLMFWFLQVVLTELSLERFYNGFLPICQLHFLVLVPIFSLS